MNWFKRLVAFITNEPTPMKELEHIHNVERDNFDYLVIFYISLKKDFPEALGTYKCARESGEKFANKHLLPALLDDNYDIVMIDLASYGLPVSWLEAAFGSLISKHGIKIETSREKLYITKPAREQYMVWRCLNRAIPLQNTSKGCYR